MSRSLKSFPDASLQEPEDNITPKLDEKSERVNDGFKNNPDSKVFLKKTKRDGTETENSDVEFNREVEDILAKYRPIIEEKVRELTPNYEYRINQIRQENLFDKKRMQFLFDRARYSWRDQAGKFLKDKRKQYHEDFKNLEKKFGDIAVPVWRSIVDEVVRHQPIIVENKKILPVGGSVPPEAILEAKLDPAIIPTAQEAPPKPKKKRAKATAHTTNPDGVDFSLEPEGDEDEVFDWSLDPENPNEHPDVVGSAVDLQEQQKLQKELAEAFADDQKEQQNAQKDYDQAYVDSVSKKGTVFKQNKKTQFQPQAVPRVNPSKVKKTQAPGRNPKTALPASEPDTYALSPEPDRPVAVVDIVPSPEPATPAVEESESNQSKNHYETLGVNAGATQEQIQVAYDNMGEKPQEIIEAYNVLSNPFSRREYDESIGIIDRALQEGGEWVKKEDGTYELLSDAELNERSIKRWKKQMAVMESVKDTMKSGVELTGKTVRTTGKVAGYGLLGSLFGIGYAGYQLAKYAWKVAKITAKQLWSVGTAFGEENPSLAKTFSEAGRGMNEAWQEFFPSKKEQKVEK